MSGGVELKNTDSTHRRIGGIYCEKRRKIRIIRIFLLFIYYACVSTNFSTARAKPASLLPPVM